MRFFSADEIHQALDFPGLVEELRTTFREGVEAVDRFSLQQPLPNGNQNDWIFLPAWQFGKYQGVKLVSVFPDNEKLGMASVQGIYLLFDGTTGVPIACMDGAAITLRKTAANSALAATFLSREDSSSLLMVGAGAMAPYLISAHCAVRPIRRIKIWNRSRKRADELVQELRSGSVGTLPTSFKSAGDAQPSIESIDDLEAAVREADIISCATMATEPMVKGAWLSKGCHLDLVGGYRPEMREADDDAIRRARVFVDARFTTVPEAGDICQPLASGVLKESDITDTFQLVRGERPGRQSPDEITLFKSGGGGHEDLGTAKYLLSKLAIAH
jgi:alanine dehydrogenase